MKKNYHKEAIELLLKTEVSFQTLVIEIAKHNPAALCKAYELLKKEDNYIFLGSYRVNKNDYEVIRAFAVSKDFKDRIEAIKKYRLLTNVGLKEAKDTIEATFGLIQQ